MSMTRPTANAVRSSMAAMACSVGSRCIVLTPELFSELGERLGDALQGRWRFAFAKPIHYAAQDQGAVAWTISEIVEDKAAARVCAHASTSPGKRLFK